jgi:hypothetical protein
VRVYENDDCWAEVTVRQTEHSLPII